MTRFSTQGERFTRDSDESEERTSQIDPMEAYTSVADSRHCSLTTGADWYRPDDDCFSLRVVEHPCHVKRMQNFICQHAVRSRGLIAVTDSRLTPDGAGIRKSSGWI